GSRWRTMPHSNVQRPTEIGAYRARRLIPVGFRGGFESRLQEFEGGPYAFEARGHRHRVAPSRYDDDARSAGREHGTGGCGTGFGRRMAAGDARARYPGQPARGADRGGRPYAGG